MGKPKDPDYWKNWRAAHPEYQERERERSRSRQRTTEDRRAERERAAVKAERDAHNRRREADEVRRWRERNPDKRKAQKQRHYSKHRKQLIARSVDNKRRRAAERLLMNAHSIAKIVVRPDGRDQVYDTLYEDAVSEALVILIYFKDRPVEFRDAMALRAVREFVKSERLYRWYMSVSLDDDLQTRLAFSS